MNSTLGITLASVAFDNMTGTVETGSTDNVVKDGGSGTEDPDAYLYDLGTKMFIIIDVILVGIGCIGNLLTLIVSLRKNQRKSPVSILIAALAISDTLVLVLDFVNNWFTLQLDIYLLQNLPFCLFHRWSFGVAYTASAWFVCAIAVERFLAVLFPIKSKMWCTVKNSVIVTIVTPLLLSVIYLYSFWTWEVNDEAKCSVHPHHAWFINEVSPWLTAVLYSYIPFLVISFCSVCIAVHLSRAKPKRSTMTRDSSADRNSRKATITMLTICVAFLCLTTPLTIWYIWVFITRQFIEQGARIVFIEICILIVGLSNHAINFFLYIITSDRFRNELSSMFTIRRGETPKATNKDKAVPAARSTLSVATSEMSDTTASSIPTA